MNYIFKLEEEQTNLLDNEASNKYRKENLNSKSINEGMFDYIYDKLMFVEKKLLFSVPKNDRCYHVSYNHYGNVFNKYSIFNRDKFQRYV